MYSISLFRSKPSISRTTVCRVTSLTIPLAIPPSYRADVSRPAPELPTYQPPTVSQGILVYPSVSVYTAVRVHVYSTLLITIVRSCYCAYYC